MTDSSFNGRLRETVRVLRAMQHEHQHVQSPVAVAILTKLDNHIADLDKLGDDLLELAGQMRGQADARSEDTSVEAKGFLAEAMEQYADRIDTADRRDRPSAGTSAYELVAAAEMANVETTETLIHMVAATVLSKLIDEEGGGRSNIAFSPADMDAMHQRYVLDATRDGMLTTVSITPREGAFEGGLHVSTASAEGGLSAPPESFYRSQEPIDSGPAKPQADIHVYDRPLWAVRIDGMLVPCSDRNAAERSVSWHTVNRTENIVQIENRFCYHDDCPADRCLHVPEQDDTADDAAEATSGD